MTPSPPAVLLVPQEANPRFFEHYLLRVRLKQQMVAFASLVPNVGEGPDPLQSSVISVNREPSMLSSREDAPLMPPSPLLRPSSPVNTDGFMNMR